MILNVVVVVVVDVAQSLSPSALLFSFTRLPYYLSFGPNRVDVCLDPSDIEILVSVPRGSRVT